MEKVTFHEYSPLLYPRSIFIVIGADKASILDHFNIVGSSDNLEFCITDIAYCHKVIEKENGRHGVMCNFIDRRRMTIMTMVHEAVHMADYIYEEIGAIGQNFTDHNEPYAYLVEWIVKCMDEVRTGKFK